MKRSLFLVFAFLTCLRVLGQATITPTYLFFDDFARYNNRLDTTKWQPKSTVYINNHFSLNPISKNIATFNGISPTGIFTFSTASNTIGIDTLTSQPVNLAGRAPSDSVYLTFYLQMGGVGTKPAPGTQFPTFFQVDLKNNNGNWVPNLRINPLPSSQSAFNYRQYTVVISDQQFLHGNFQFRFRSFGDRRLSEDTYNLDYITVGFNRRKAQTRIDVTTSRRVSPLLQRYTAMPIHQFMANIAGELNDSVFTTLNNLENDFRGITTTTSIQVGNNAPVPFANHAIPIRPNYLQYDSFPDKPATSIFTGLSGFQTIKSIVAVTTGEQTPETLYNDTISRVTELKDYYAYDDGTAEGLGAKVLKLGGPIGQVAVRFNLNQQDRVKTISVFIPKMGNTKNRVVNFKIWNVAQDGTPDGNGIFTTSFTVPDISLLDNWFDIPVNPSVIVNNAFFVGWSFNGATPLFSVGLDLNKNTTIYTAESGLGWTPTNEGTLLLRVTMNNNVTGTSEVIASNSNQAKLYPNPATDHVLVQGRFEMLRLLSATGQLLLERKGNGTETRLETQNLKPGFYLVQLQQQNRVETHKLLIQTP